MAVKALTSQEVENLPKVRCMAPLKNRIMKQVKKSGVPQYKVASEVIKAGLTALGY